MDAFSLFAIEIQPSSVRLRRHPRARPTADWPAPLVSPPRHDHDVASTTRLRGGAAYAASSTRCSSNSEQAATCLDPGLRRGDEFEAHGDVGWVSAERVTQRFLGRSGRCWVTRPTGLTKPAARRLLRTGDATCSLTVTYSETPSTRHPGAGRNNMRCAKVLDQLDALQTANKLRPVWAPAFAGVTSLKRTVT